MRATVASQSFLYSRIPFDQQTTTFVPAVYQNKSGPLFCSGSIRQNECFELRDIRCSGTRVNSMRPGTDGTFHDGHCRSVLQWRFSSDAVELASLLR